MDYSPCRRRGNSFVIEHLNSSNTMETMSRHLSLVNCRMSTRVSCTFDLSKRQECRLLPLGTALYASCGRSLNQRRRKTVPLTVSNLNLISNRGLEFGLFLHRDLVLSSWRTRVFVISRDSGAYTANALTAFIGRKDVIRFLVRVRRLCYGPRSIRWKAKETEFTSFPDI